MLYSSPQNKTAEKSPHPKPCCISTAPATRITKTSEKRIPLAIKSLDLGLSATKEVHNLHDRTLRKELKKTFTKEKTSHVNRFKEPIEFKGPDEVGCGGTCSQHLGGRGRWISLSLRSTEQVPGENLKKKKKNQLSRLLKIVQS